MEISKTPKITPDGPPASCAGEEYVWTKLVPRLLSPGALSIIHLLLQEGKALRLREIAAAVELQGDHARYHCEAMERRGVLAVVQLHPRTEGDGDEPSFFFPKPPQPVPPSPSPSPPSTSPCR
jgi:hypothetical protein